MREILSSFISLLFGFSSTWSTDNASVKITTLPMVLLLLLATVLAASDMASVSARKLLENLPVGIDMVSLSLSLSTHNYSVVKPDQRTK